MGINSDIPWKRISAEAVAIVASILLAFAIDAWWSENQRDEHLRSVMDRLAEKFVENIALTSKNIDVASSGRDQLQKFIRFEPNGSDTVPPDGGFELIIPISRPYTDVSNNSVIVSMLDREDLTPISGNRLMDAIDRWRARVDQIKQGEFQLEEFQSEALMELARHPQLALIYSDLFGSGRSRQLDNEAVIGARRDERVTAIAVKKSVILASYIRHLQSLREEAEDALAEIRALQPASPRDDAG